MASSGPPIPSELDDEVDDADLPFEQAYAALGPILSRVELIFGEHAVFKYNP